jgi:hypothetical protein
MHIRRCSYPPADPSAVSSHPFKARPVRGLFVRVKGGPQPLSLSLSISMFFLLSVPSFIRSLPLFNVFAIYVCSRMQVLSPA